MALIERAKKNVWSHFIGPYVLFDIHIGMQPKPV